MDWKQTWWIRVLGGLSYVDFFFTEDGLNIYSCCNMYESCILSPPIVMKNQYYAIYHLDICKHTVL